MKRVIFVIHRRKVVAALALSLMAFLNISYAATIAAPSTVVSTIPESFSVDAANLLVSPNNNAVQFSSSTQATFGDFKTTATYDTEKLALLMGISSETLSNADFFAFDANNGSVGFEDSVWFFSDGVNSLNHVHDFSDGENGPMLINGGRINIGTEYNAIFGTSFANGTDFGVILFDLSSFGIDVNNTDFQFSLQGGGISCGTECPDVTFVGAVVPIPPASMLFFSALLGAFGLKQRKA